MKISINSPSYKRPNEVLILNYIPDCKIWVDEGEYNDYKIANEDAAIISCPRGIQGNVARVRNYIMDREFEAGADVVVMVDDDLSCIERFIVDGCFGYKKEKIRVKELYMLIEKYSIMAKDMGVYMWGVNCNSDNLSYNHYTPFSTLCFLGGPFQVFLRGNECRYDEKLPLKEDYDMLIQQCLKYRGILRVNYLHFYCKQSVNKGGCSLVRNREYEWEQFELLRKKWGDRIVKRDRSNRGHSIKQKLDDYNPIVNIPIKGV